MKRKKNIKKRILCIVSTMLLAFSVNAPITVSAFQLPDAIKDYVDDYVDLGTDSDLEDIIQNVDISEEFSIIEQIIMDIMKSDWYKDTDIQSRKEKIAELLAATGYIDKETVEMGLDAILNFEFHGQKIGVWLEDYAENPYGEGGEDDYEQRDDIIDGLSGDREAVILYGLGFPEFDDALDYSTIKWNNNGLRTNKNDACTVDNFKTDLNGKDLIVIEEHGCTYGDEPLIVTEDEYDPESGEYQEDLDAERLSILITDEGAQYCLTPSFFEYYYSGGKLANSFVWIGSCYGASNSRLVDAFVNTGANAVVGHSDSVYTAYDYNMLNTVVDKMISGESSSEAFQEARDYWGQNDEQFAIRYMEVDTKEEAPASYPSLTGDIRWE